MIKCKCDPFWDYEAPPHAATQEDLDRVGEFIELLAKSYGENLAAIIRDNSD